MHPEAGLTDYYPAEVAVRRTIIDHTAATYVLADSSKLGEIAVHRVCTLDRVTAVLTDDAENSTAFAALAEAGLALLRAQVTEPSQLTAAGGRPRPDRRPIAARARPARGRAAEEVMHR